MANRKLFGKEIILNPNPPSTMRIAFGDTGTTVQNMTLANLRTYITGSTAPPASVLTKSVDIGSWNMDSTRVKNVSTGVALSKIRGVEATIKSDSGEMFVGYYRRSNWELSMGVKVCNTPTNNAVVSLERNDGGVFDKSGFNSTTVNRGYIIINYVP